MSLRLTFVRAISLGALCVLSLAALRVVAQAATPATGLLSRMPERRSTSSTRRPRRPAPARSTVTLARRRRTGSRASSGSTDSRHSQPGNTRYSSAARGSAAIRLTHDGKTAVRQSQRQGDAHRAEQLRVSPHRRVGPLVRELTLARTPHYERNAESERDSQRETDADLWPLDLTPGSRRHRHRRL